MPYLAGRFGIIDEMRVIPGAEGRATAAKTFRGLYWDTAASWGDRAAHAARRQLRRFLLGRVEPYPIRLVNWFMSK